MNEKQINAIKELLKRAEDVAGNEDLFQKALTEIMLLLIKVGGDPEFTSYRYNEEDASWALGLAFDYSVAANKYLDSIKEEQGGGMELVDAAKASRAIEEDIKNLTDINQIVKRDDIWPVLDRMHKNNRMISMLLNAQHV